MIGLTTRNKRTGENTVFEKNTYAPVRGMRRFWVEGTTQNAAERNFCEDIKVSLCGMRDYGGKKREIKEEKEVMKGKQMNEKNPVKWINPPRVRLP